MSALIVGCGYVGKTYARLTNPKEGFTWGIVRRRESADQLESLGIRPIILDWMEIGPWPNLPEVEDVLVSVSHRTSKESIDPFAHVRGLSRLIEQLGSFRRLIYLSSTGVYADADDSEWLDEKASVHPGRAGTVSAWNAEQWLENRFAQIPGKLCILRLAGIYGPHRVPNLETIRAQQPIPVDPDSYLNLIHVDDIAGIIQTVFRKGEIQIRYNVSDGHPVMRGDFYRYLAEKLQVPAPQFTSNNLSENTGRRGSSHKKISNQLLVRDLGYQFQYSNYQLGFDALLARDET